MKPDFRVASQSEVFIGPVADLLPGLLPQRRIIAVSDPTVAKLHAGLLSPYRTLLIGEGEREKSLATVEKLYRGLMAAGADRSTFILAVGGGMVSDVAGFAAATYMRGLEFGFVPTTLLAQVDASIGGKNGVNIDGYKNMAGTFAQPRFVVCDPALLSTLPEREFRAGMAEVVKAAVIADSDLFERIERSSLGALRTDTDLLADAISASVRVKADIVGRDEHETGERRKLNLGHTLAHAIEKCSSEMNHGEAVAVGMALISDAALRLGVLSATDRDRIRGLLERLGFRLDPPVPLPRLLEETGRDKKSEGEMLRIVLPAGIGDCEVRPMPQQEFAALFAAV